MNNSIMHYALAGLKAEQIAISEQQRQTSEQLQHLYAATETPSEPRKPEIPMTVSVQPEPEPFNALATAKNQGMNAVVDWCLTQTIEPVTMPQPVVFDSLNRPPSFENLMAQLLGNE
jgi:hypothetical protein